MFGAICGDILGSTFEFDTVKYDDISQIKLFCDTDTFTDDTALTVAVAEWLVFDIEKNFADDAALKRSLAERFVECSLDRFCGASLGFGGRYWEWVNKAKLTGEYAPYHSFGNGSAMRVSPVGFAFDTMEETLRFAKLSADVTHDHPEGQKGAMCIAAAVFLARNGKTKEEIRDWLYRAFGYSDLLLSVSQLRYKYDWSEICQDTVPQAVVAFLESTDFESAIRLALSYGSDSDTIGAMTGAIAEAFYGGVPQYIADFCNGKLPDDIRDSVKYFYSEVCKL